MELDPVYKGARLSFPSPRVVPEWPFGKGGILPAVDDAGGFEHGEGWIAERRWSSDEIVARRTFDATMSYCAVPASGVGAERRTTEAVTNQR